MALATYSDLQTSVANWAWRAGDTDFTTSLPDILTMTEQMFNYGTSIGGQMLDPIRTTDMETQASATLSNGEVELPSDYLEYREVWCSSSGCPIELKYGTPTELRQKFGTRAGTPTRFTIIGNTLIVYPSADATTIDITYFAKVPALSDSNTTNWLLTKYPMVYLYGALVHAAPYMREDDRIGTFVQMYKGAIDGMKLSFNRHHYSRGAARVSGPTP